MHQSSHSCWPLAAVASCCTPLLALAVVAAMACSGGEGGEETAPLPRDLIAPPTVPFEVVFYWQAPLRGDAEGYFVWRQGNGLRRWDLVMFHEGKAGASEFSIESDFSPGERWGRGGMTCSYYQTSAPSNEVSVSCGEGSQLPSRPLQEALWATVVRKQWVSEEQIAGRTATCYSLWFRGYDRMVFCLDARAGIPLLLDTEAPWYITNSTNMAESMVALSVSTADQNLVIPVQLEPNPDYPDLPDLRKFEGTVNTSALQLPDLPRFEQ
jgi:hypothetical protein